MQNNNQTNIFKWLVILLVVLNIGILATVWFKHFPPPPDEMRRPPNGEKVADFLIEQLNFSAQQLADFTKLKQAHSQAVDSIRESGKETHRLFFENLKTEKQDTVMVNELAQAISANQMQIELVTFKHFEQVRKLCDEKQKEKFDEIIQEVLRRMAAPPGKKGSPLPRN
jgi:hypothetical protein